MDADRRPTGNPLLDLVAARRRDQPGTEAAAAPEPAPEPDPEPEPRLPEGPLAVAARLRRQRATASVEAGIVVSANGAPGRLHALHRRKTRGFAVGS